MQICGIIIPCFAIYSTGGLILDFAVDKYRGIAVFSPVMNGVGGNLVAVQASRLSTGLHQLGKPGQVQEKSKFHGCIDTFFGSGMFGLRSKHPQQIRHNAP